MTPEAPLRLPEPPELAAGEFHVRQPAGELTWCGVPVLFGEWTFVSATHARIFREAKREKQACPRCWAAIQQRR